MGRETNLIKCVGDQSFAEIRNSKVLLVGAGGIGCELLKDLILLQIGEIHIVDLDTIDLSNLNRQFLFRQQDIKQPKSATAIKAVQRFNDSKLFAYQGNIMDNDQFPLSWFDQFAIVYNALDNLAARRYVNKISQFTRKPLIESGTSGFDGYIQPIIPGKTECFDCTTKETPTTFPVCTIRSTPSLPVHCVVWAKNFLFNQLFSDVEEQTVGDQDFGTEDPLEIERIKQETNELHELQKLAKSGDESKIPTILKKLFVDDINKLLLISNLWKTRTKPVPLSNVEQTDDVPTDMAVTWTQQQNINKFIEVTAALMRRLKTEPIIEFDKDDEDTLLFVSCAANIRSSIFQIPEKSVFDIKQIAGNIIPAIATTNAIIAGLSSLVSLRVLNLIKTVPNDPFSLPMVFTARASNITTNRYLSNPTLAPGNKKCAVCSNIQRGIMGLPRSVLDKITLYDLNQKIISKYGFTGEYSVLDTNTNSLLYDFDFDDLEGRKLSRFNFKTGTVLLYKDEEMSDGEELRVSIEFYLEILDDNSTEEIQLPDLERLTYIYESSYSDSAQDNEDEQKQAETLILDDEIAGVESLPKKRSFEGEDQSVTKVAKLEDDIKDDDDIVMID